MYTIAQRASMAQTIDTILGTQVATTAQELDVDALLDWMTAVANAVKAAGTTLSVTPPSASTITQLQSQVQALQTQLSALQTTVQNTIAASGG